MDLALNNPQWLICHNTKTNKHKGSPCLKINSSDFKLHQIVKTSILFHYHIVKTK